MRSGGSWAKASRSLAVTDETLVLQRNKQAYRRRSSAEQDMDSSVIRRQWHRRIIHLYSVQTQYKCVIKSTLDELTNTRDYTIHGSRQLVTLIISPQQYCYFPPCTGSKMGNIWCPPSLMCLLADEKTVFHNHSQSRFRGCEATVELGDLRT